MSGDGEQDNGADNDTRDEKTADSINNNQNFAADEESKVWWQDTNDKQIALFKTWTEEYWMKFII